MPTVKRLVDGSLALSALMALSPLLLIAAVGIKLSSPGPIFFRAPRIARDRRRRPPAAHRSAAVGERRQSAYRGREFTIYKFRTMRVSSGPAVPITAWQDARVFRFGSWLRSSKIDELPQLVNVIKGDMALVGPRPEAPEIVRRYYTEADLGTLQVLPGLTSPGTVYYYTHCEAMLGHDAVVDSYVAHVLPVKLALDRVYIRHASLGYDIRLIVRTLIVVVGRAFGRQRFPEPPELAEVDASLVAAHRAQRLLA